MSLKGIFVLMKFRKKCTVQDAPTKDGLWQVSTPAFILVVALGSAILYHFPLYKFAVNNLDISSPGGIWTLLTLFVLVFFANVVALSALSVLSQWLLKPAVMLMAVINSIALYFIVVYGGVLDKTMMGNVVNTDFAEASALFHPMLLVYLAAFGLLPIWLLARISVRPVSLIKRITTLAVATGLTLCWLVGASWTWLWIDKYAKQVGAMVLPWSPVINGARYLSSNLAPSPRAVLPAGTFASSNRKVVVLIIGESARAQNFSLYGYRRQTNPRMSLAGVSVIRNASSCATYTTASLECILSHTTSGDEGKWEVLTTYLQRSGVEVTWRSHNAGEPPMKVLHYQKLEDVKQTCVSDECNYDGGLLFGLESHIADSKGPRTLVVLHLTGSHGPAYNTRYPASFEEYKPVCNSVQLQQCSQEELINAYDNSIRYTDHVVGQTIDLLRRLDIDATLFFIADHGESLGEGRLYLHGTPWLVAPEEQKRIPFIVWNSRENIKENTTTKFVDGAFTQASVFHSVLGAFDMRSPVYKPELDVLPKVGRP